jgi:hypothetical protein
MTIWQRIEELLDACDGHLELVVAAECAWSGELRIGLANPPNAPARSVVFFSAGGEDPLEVAHRLMAAYEAWRSEI